jgi:SAM-dependent methyltransferase
MPNDVFEPFNADISSHGGYQYARPGRRSAVYANRRYSDVVIRHARLDGKRVVDVGCGDGTYTAVLRAETKAAFILGIDPAAKAVEFANAAHAPGAESLAFRNCFASDLIAQGEHFDVAIYRGVIHHVGDPAAEIAAALRLADTVFFLEPNGANPVVKLIELLSRYHRSHKERSYFLSRYRAWIEDSGGRVEEGFYFGLVPFFCPDWFVTVGSALEPVVERIPGLRALACGQLGILAASR